MTAQNEFHFTHPQGEDQKNSTLTMTMTPECRSVLYDKILKLAGQEFEPQAVEHLGDGRMKITMTLNKEIAHGLKFLLFHVLFDIKEN